MTEHRNLALTTAGIFLALAVLAWRKVSKQSQIGWLFTIGMLLGGSVLASTAWHGGELVYRHGLGVMSLPDAGHHHHGAAGHNHDEEHNGAHDHDDRQSAAPAALEHDHDHDATSAGTPSREDEEHAHEHEHEESGATHVHPDGTVHTH